MEKKEIRHKKIRGSWNRSISLESSFGVRGSVSFTCATDDKKVVAETYITSARIWCPTFSDGELDLHSEEQIEDSIAILQDILEIYNKYPKYSRNENVEHEIEGADEGISKLNK